MIVLDGSYGEGGGQMLRTALALSLVTHEPFRIERIRQGRPQPGLKAQHLHIVKALLLMSDSEVDGIALGSTALSFWPGRLRGGEYQLDIGTAGAIALVMQTLVPVAMIAGAPLRWQLRGGTNGRGAMTMDFWQQVILPLVRPYASAITLEVRRHGYYPAGGGEVILRVTPEFGQDDWHAGRLPYRPLALAERGEFQRVRAISRAAKQLAARRVAERQAETFCKAWRDQAPQVQTVYDDAYSPGSALTAVAEYSASRLGADVIGERGKPAERIGEEGAERLRAEMASEATVDVHTADNLMVWAALFGGVYHVAQRTGHIETNAWVIEHFLPGALRLDGLRVVGRAE
jgi:RNA 3'-phosphate cyclase